MSSVVGTPPKPGKVISDAAPVEDRGVIIQQTPVNLRTIIYQDAKSFAKKVWKVFLIAIIVVVVYYISGLWGLVSFLAFLPVAYAIIPMIAKKFMSYTNFFVIHLDNEGKADKVSVLSIPVPRAEKALYLDDAGQKAGLNAPFMSELGLTWCADKIVLNEPVPGMPPDITIDKIILHNVHKNMDFVNNYVPVFLDVRKDNLLLRKENFALRSLEKINVIKGYVDKTEVFFDLCNKIVMEGGSPSVEERDKLDVLIKEINELKGKLGVSTETPFQKVEEVEPIEPIPGVIYSGPKVVK